MKALLQRVTEASVSVGDDVVGKVGWGLVVFLGIANEDTESEARYLADRLANLRIFADAASKFNLSALETGAEILVVSQFTLLADTRKGRRPSFTEAAPPELAEALVEHFVGCLKAMGLRVEVGRFQAHMLVKICNDGPVTIMLESKKK